MTSTIVHDDTITRPLRAITQPRTITEQLDRVAADRNRPRPRTWPAPDHTPGRRRADRIGVVAGARAVTTFPGVDLARTAARKAQPGRPVTVSALLARIGGTR